MSEHEHRTPEEAARQSVQRSCFLLQHRDALRALLHGHLFKPVPGSTAWRGKEWRNVAEHCITVARGLDALGALLGCSDEEREHMVKVGLVHDWNKRLTNNPDAFSAEERAKAEAYATSVLKKHDPKGYLIDATEPRGLPRLESDKATLAEHCVHYVDLCCLPEGVVGPEERFKDFERRGKTSDEDGQVNMWARKKHLVAKEEAMFLDALRARGTDVAADTRLHELVRDAMNKA